MVCGQCGRAMDSVWIVLVGQKTLSVEVVDGVRAEDGISKTVPCQ